MDEIDRQIIMDLEIKGFQNKPALGHLYGLSERTIHRRISNLIGKNIVKMVVTQNFVLLGYQAWARVGIKVVPGSISHVSRALIKNPAVYFVAYTLGMYDIIISVYFTKIDELIYFVNSQLNNVEGVLSAETVLLVQPRKYMLYSWPAPVFRNNENVPGSYYDSTTSHAHYQLDELDRNILNILTKDGPIRPKLLASRLDIGEGKIRKRLKTLWQNDVYKIEAVPTIDVVEYQTQAQILITTGGESPHKIIDLILKHSSVYLASTCLGRFNLLIAARFRNPNFLEEFITETLPSIPGIKSAETCLQIKRLKYFNLTWPIP